MPAHLVRHCPLVELNFPLFRVFYHFPGFLPLSGPMNSSDLGFCHFCIFRRPGRDVKTVLSKLTFLIKTGFLPQTGFYHKWVFTHKRGFTTFTGFSQFCQNCRKPASFTVRNGPNTPGTTVLPQMGVFTTTGVFYHKRGFTTTGMFYHKRGFTTNGYFHHKRVFLP